MTDKAIIQGSLVDVRNVNQHKCVRMLIDVPAEHAPMVMAAFGWPTMATPVPVAIARLQEPAKQGAVDYGAEFDAEMKKPVKPTRKWDQLSRAEQAGMKCEDPEFQNFLIRTYNWPPEIGNETADVVRHLCGVNSRSRLDEKPEAAKRWDKIYGDFQMWQRGAAA